MKSPSRSTPPTIPSVSVNSKSTCLSAHNKVLRGLQRLADSFLLQTSSLLIQLVNKSCHLYLQNISRNQLPTPPALLPPWSKPLSSLSWVFAVSSYQVSRGELPCYSPHRNLMVIVLRNTKLDHVCPWLKTIQQLTRSFRGNTTDLKMSIRLQVMPYFPDLLPYNSLSRQLQGTDPSQSIEHTRLTAPSDLAATLLSAWE